MAVTTLGERAVSSTVKLNENGTPVEFYVAKHDYEGGLNGAGRTLLVRKDCYGPHQWHTSQVNAYAVSSMDAWLNTGYKAMLDPDIQAAIGTTKFYYIPGNGNWSVAALERSVFLLSYPELNNRGNDGTVLPSAGTLKIARFNGSAVVQWTRTPYEKVTTSAYCLNIRGELDYHTCASGYYARPSFTLPSSACVRDDGCVYINSAPTISGSPDSGADLGVKTEGFTLTYTVEDADGDEVTVKEYLDGALLRSYTAAPGEVSTFQFANWQKVLNGSHILKVVANDGRLDSAPYTVSFTKLVTQATITLEEPLEADGQISIMVMSVAGSLPAGAALSVLVTNNAKDEEPVWEDATEDIKAGVNHVFTNQTAANGFAFNFRLSVSRGESGQGGYISGVGGAFE